MWLEYLLSRGLSFKKVIIFEIISATKVLLYSKIYSEENNGELAQLARASALQAEGQRFESVILHHLPMREMKTLVRTHTPKLCNRQQEAII